ncbi:unnamed protein product, partial [Prorocentrum cordatum]
AEGTRRQVAGRPPRWRPRDAPRTTPVVQRKAPPPQNDIAAARWRGVSWHVQACPPRRPAQIAERSGAERAGDRTLRGLLEGRLSQSPRNIVPNPGRRTAH